MKLSVALWVVVDALAVYRLTILVTRDIITEPLRHQVMQRFGDYWFDFVTCPWCTSVWLAGGVVVVTRLLAWAWVYVALLLAFSAVAGTLAEWTH